MGQYDKYYLYKKQRAVSGTSNWEDVITADGLIYSYDGDGTMPPIMAEQNSQDCGYQPTIEPIYRWIDLNPNVDYYCEECEEPPTPPTPSSTTKFYATYSNGTSYSAECDSNTTLSQSTTRAHSTSYTAMTTAEIGDCITAIGDQAFYYCRVLSSVTIPNTVTSIGNSSFKNASGFTEITIPNSVTSIGTSAFQDCRKLTSVTIPNSVTSIGTSAFASCKGLTSCTIGSGITSIDNSAFYSCDNIASMTIYAETPPTITSSYTFYGSYPIYVPAASLSAYQTAWSSYSSTVSRLQAIPNS